MAKMCLNKSVVGLFRSSQILVRVPRAALMVPVRTKCETNGIVVGVYTWDGEKDPKMTASGEKFDDRLNGKITELIRETSLTGEVGKGMMFSNLDKEYQTVAVVGVGQDGAGFDAEEELDVGMENTRIAAAVGTRFLQYQGAQTVFVDGMDFPEQAAEGAAMAVWRFENNKRKNKRMQTPKLELYGSSDVDAWTRGLFKAESQNLARRLTDTPSNLMTPSIFAQSVIDALCPCGVTVNVRAMDWIEEQRLNSFLTIAKGSCEPPIILEVNYCGSSPEDRPVLLMGQGLTFNSGGIGLRNRKGLDLHRADVSGAACIVAAIRAAAALSLPINILGFLPLCENVPSGMAVKPGDVITLLNGKTLCIKNPENAGTVMMADLMLFAQVENKPKLILNIGNHGRSVMYGLDSAATGLWTNSAFIWEQFKKSGSLSGDRMWRMPLWDFFKRLVEPNMTYDMCNEGIGPATSCLAAALLHKMVSCCDWVFLDTWGTGMLAKYAVPPYLLKDRMTGRPTRTLIQFMYQLSCK